MRAVRSVFAALVLAIASWNAMAAAALTDPTRPMDFATGSAAPSTPAHPAAPVLQSTLVSPDRKSAIISGKTVKIGDKFRGAVVTDITAYEVRLSQGGRETSLRLLPKLQKEKGTVE